MNQSGPILQTLLHRLAETPADFLIDAAGASKAAANDAPTLTAALVNDLLTRVERPLDGALLKRFVADAGNDNRLAVTRLIVWLLADAWFKAAPLRFDELLKVLDQTAGELASEARAQKFIDDPDRREELARIVLARLDYRPQDETVAQASDRLTAISSSERRRLVEASRETERRARAIREALVRKQAEESADKWTRE